MFTLDQQREALIAQQARIMVERDSSYVMPTVDPYHRDRGITGEPSEKNRVYRASDDCWKRGMRGKTVGIAPGSDVATPSVLVTLNGHSEIVPASHFRKENVHKKQRSHAKNVATTQRRIMAADLAPIGNID